jgi:hypothetical protein
MKHRTLLLLALLAPFSAPAALAQIQHVQMRVEGMT